MSDVYKPSFITPERYWDIVEVAKTNDGTYSDFESMLSEEDFDWITNWAKRLEESEQDELRLGGADLKEFVIDMVTHFLVENVSEAGYRPTEQDIWMFIDAIVWVFSSRYWLKRTAE